jgi:L-rhamnose mutarotase
VSTGLNEQLPLPENSITKNRINDALAKDFREAFSFYDFLQNVQTRLNHQQYSGAYKNYLQIWSLVKSNDGSQTQQLIKDRYVELLKDISLNYLTFEEKRFLKLVDFNDPNDLDIIIPLYSKKIIEICKYHTEKREKTKHSANKNQERGTKKSIESAIQDSLTDYVFISDDENLVYNLPKLKLEEIINTLDIEIEELIDVFTTYLDGDPSLSYEDYDTKNQLRQQLFLANTNDIDGNIFLDFDAATRSYIFQILSIFLKETGRVFTINYDITKVNLNCKSGDKLYDLVTKYKDYAANILDFKSLLIKKFIGVDFYYIKTGDTSTDIEQGKLFEADNASGNLLNRHFPSTATVEEDSQLKTLRKIGLFFKPEKTGLLNFSVPKNHYVIDYTKLEPNKLYIYPDPNRYGNTVGLTNNHHSEYPLIHTQDYTPIIKKISDGFTEGDIFSNPKEQNFYGYIAKNQLAYSRITNKRGLEVNFSPIANRGKITKWNSDIFGNEFVLFEPTTFKSYKDNRTTINQSITAYDKFDGGVFLFDDNTQLPALCSSSNLGWPGNIFNSEYYYNILLEGGIGGIVDGMMIAPSSLPSLSSNASFSYNYILSSILYANLDGGNFLQNEIYGEFDSSKNIYLNEVNSTHTTSTLILPSINKKEIYVKNIRYNTISNITEACSSIFKKYNYNALLSSELIYKLSDFNIFNDLIYIRTENFIIFDKYNFDGKFYSVNNPNYILSGNLSEPFFFENKNFSLICKVDILSGVSLSSSIIPTLYKISYKDANIENIDIAYDANITQDVFKNTILPVVFTRVSKPVLTYNSRNKIYAICCTLFDNNNMPYIYEIFFKYDNITLTILNVNIISLMKQGSYKTVDFINNEQNVLFNINCLNPLCVVATTPLEGSLDFYEY